MNKKEIIEAIVYLRKYKTETDRIEVLNPGTLYCTNKLEKLGTDEIME